MQDKIRILLLSNVDKKYQKFSSSLVPNCGEMLGVRIPILRKIAKDISKKDWKYYINTNEYLYFEEKMLVGMVIGYAISNIKTVFKYIDIFLPHIDNWSVCDSFCTTIKITDANKETFWEYIKYHSKTESEFQLRFSIVMIQRHFIEKDKLDDIYAILKNITHQGYYVKMA